MAIEPVSSDATVTTRNVNSGGSSITIDPSSQYYLHHSDNPATILVSTPLDGDNYPTWSRAMKVALYAENKMGFVDGTLPKPTSTAYDVQVWERWKSVPCYLVYQPESLWEELSSYTYVPECSCGAQRALNTINQQERVYQFLMGLSDSFAGVRSHILTMNPLPDVNRI
ncbi:uncharacterized protein LOC143885824 [Tasmannia lanceolata]|uniref:uncharacterized protein LOC143885824 n=1 Tax=Tasmannia lanceolata TaxID=3420 RepID=UPI004063B416